MLVKRKLITKECVYEKVIRNRSFSVCLNCKYDTTTGCAKFPNISCSLCGLSYISRKNRAYISGKTWSLGYVYRAI